MPAGEVVDLVDELDLVVGSAMLEECLSRGLLHRAVAVVVERSDGRVLLQKRSKTDIWHPGLWTLSSTGHVRRGEEYVFAAARELREELGLASSLSFVAKLLLKPIKSGHLTEWEWVSIYHSLTDDEVNIDPTELDSAKEFTIGQVKSMVSGRLLTPDAKVTLRLFLEARVRRDR